MNSDSRKPTEEIPVVITGAGPVGLTMSILLWRQGIRNCIVERREKINTLPRSRGITARTVEILSQVGLAETVKEISTPPQWTKNFVYTSKLAGELIGIAPTSVWDVGTADRITPV